MSKIREVQFRAQVNEKLVEWLERALARAKSGELTGGHFAGATRDGSAVMLMAYGNDRLRELAAVTRLKHRIQLDLDEDVEEDE